MKFVNYHHEMDILITSIFNNKNIKFNNKNIKFSRNMF
jgi:hypothetical protein